MAITLDLVALGAEVRERRQALGLSQRQLAERVGIKQPDVSVIESGQVVSGMLMVARLALALGMQPSRLAAIAYSEAVDESVVDSD